MNAASAKKDTPAAGTLEVQMLSDDGDEDDVVTRAQTENCDHLRVLRLNGMDDDDDNKCYEHGNQIDALSSLSTAKSQSLPYATQAVLADEHLRAYIQYQQQLIGSLRTEITDTYTPLLLDNKELELNLQCLVSENALLKQENEALSREVREFELEVVAIRSDVQKLLHGLVANEDETEFHRSVTRQMSSSFIDLQENLSSQESELNELRHDLKSTRKRSEQKHAQNESLQRINEQYMAINERLRHNVNTLKSHLSEQHKTVRERTEDINQLKLALFEKTQSIEQLTRVHHDLALKNAFTYAHALSARDRSKDDNANVLRVVSVRSAASTTDAPRSVDVWNELLLSPGRYGGLGGVSSASTPYHGPLYTEGDSLQRTNSKDSVVHDSLDYLDSMKDEYIQILKKDLNDLQEKYDADIANLQTKLAVMMQTKTETKQCTTRALATQTKPPKQKKTLGFWERLMTDFRCFPLE